MFSARPVAFHFSAGLQRFDFPLWQLRFTGRGFRARVIDRPMKVRALPKRTGVVAGGQSRARRKSVGALRDLGKAMIPFDLAYPRFSVSAASVLSAQSRSLR